MQRKLLIIFVGICLLLVYIIVLHSVIRHNTFSEEIENNTLIILNQDNTTHEVTVKLFDSNNSSIFDELYVLDPEKEIKSQYPARLVTGTSIDVTLNIGSSKNDSFFKG
jgi:hypothetical protein